MMQTKGTSRVLSAQRSLRVCAALVVLSPVVAGFAQVVVPAAAQLKQESGQVQSQVPDPEPKKLVWTQESVTGPLERAGAVMVYDSNLKRCVLFGGVNVHKRLNDTWVWDGRFWRQKNTDGQIPEIWAASAVYDSQRGRVVLFGGAKRGGSFNHSTFEFDGERWTKVAEDGPRARNYMWQMAYDSRRGRTVLYGGASVAEVDGKIVHGPDLDDTWEWDGKKWQQVAKGGPPPSTSHGMVFDEHRGVTLILVKGKVVGEDGKESEQAETWTWDGAVWRRVYIGGPPRQDVNLVRLVYDSERKLVVGLLAKAQGNRHEVVLWEWDGAAWKEEKQDPMPHIFNGNAAAYDSSRQRLVVFCGINALTEGKIGETWEYGLEYVGP